MPKVSVLMNCYNGEKYLKEAIDSVFAQTYTDWEIIFIDNCSIDSSSDIAKSYGDRVKCYKTVKNIPLGAARNFGIKQCSGKYIAFLDVDDVWLPSAIEKLLVLITSGDYALAYAGLLSIDVNGAIIGKTRPKKQKGMIFGELLKQFDVPIVASMVSSQHLLKSDLLFDNNIHASEEYCLFMQLAAKYCFISVNEIVTKYRIHDNALTKKTVSRWADERRYTLDTIIKENPGIRKIYQKEFKEAYARADYYEARFLLFLDKKKAARGLLRKHIFQDIRYFLLYFMLYLPKKLQSYILHSKYNR